MKQAALFAGWFILCNFLGGCEKLTADRYPRKTAAPRGFPTSIALFFLNFEPLSIIVFDLFVPKRSVEKCMGIYSYCEFRLHF